MIMHSMGFTNALDISQQYLYLGIMDGISNNILIVIEFIFKVTVCRNRTLCIVVSSWLITVNLLLPRCSRSLDIQFRHNIMRIPMGNWK